MLNAQTILQNAYVVNDIDAAILHWHRTFNIGPFFLTRHVSVEKSTYRGTHTPIDFSVAIAQAGDVQVELIQQHCTSPSGFRDMYPAGSEGHHHIAVFADNYDEEVARYAQQAAPVATSGVFGGARFCYVDARETIGVFVEILEENAGIRAYFDQIRTTANDPRWVGKPVYLP